LCLTEHRKGIYDFMDSNNLSNVKVLALWSVDSVLWISSRFVTAVKYRLN